MELLLNLPIWLLLLVAMVRFEESLSDGQQLSLASRVGAREASQTVDLPSTGSVPPGICDLVARQLHNAGMVCSQVIVEHNVRGKYARLAAGEGCGPPPCDPLPTVGRYVRVTVFSGGKKQATTLRYTREPETR